MVEQDLIKRPADEAFFGRFSRIKTGVAESMEPVLCVDGEVGVCFGFGNDFPIVIPQHSFRMVRLEACPGEAVQRYGVTAKGMPQAVVRPLDSSFSTAFAMATWTLARGMMEPSVFACGVSHAARFSGISTSFRRLSLGARRGVGMYCQECKGRVTGYPDAGASRHWHVRRTERLSDAHNFPVGRR
jgi:hypothetical protein